MKKTLPLKFYSAATRALSSALPLWLKKRARSGKEDPARLGERQGKSEYSRPHGKIIWMHAASVGESQMLMPVISRILSQHPNFHIVITTGTVTSAKLLEKTLPQNAFHQYAPADHPKAVRNFLAHWQPNMAIFAESELWPNMIMQTKETGIPLALINARMSAKSIERWNKRGKKSGQALLSCFDLILAADKTTADGLTELMGKEIKSSGNLKDAATTLSVDEQALEKLKLATKGRTIWCAASTHEGEEELIAKAALKVKKHVPNSLLILAPRHPERSKSVKSILVQTGLKTLQRSSRRMPNADTDVYIIDAIGHMGLAYRLANTAFIGGSLIDGLSGHNPLEPARLGCAIITGRYIASFADTYMALFAYDAAKSILSSDELAPALIKSLGDTAARTARTDAALKFAHSRNAVLDYVWAQLSPLLPDHQKGC
ncbi:MAG: 3-deoxy-D-manno-octulosonic acid transferase [Robiginitomaculum sp.]